MAIAAACFRAKLSGRAAPARPVNAGPGCSPVYRRTAGDRGRGQARPFSVADLAVVLATPAPEGDLVGRDAAAAW